MKMSVYCLVLTKTTPGNIYSYPYTYTYTYTYRQHEGAYIHTHSDIHTCHTNTHIHTCTGTDIGTSNARKMVHSRYAYRWCKDEKGNPQDMDSWYAHKQETNAGTFTHTRHLHIHLHINIQLVEEYVYRHIHT